MGVRLGCRPVGDHAGPAIRAATAGTEHTGQRVRQVPRQIGQSSASSRSSAALAHSSSSTSDCMAAYGRISISLNAIRAGDTSRPNLGRHGHLERERQRRTSLGRGRGAASTGMPCKKRASYPAARRDSFCLCLVALAASGNAGLLIMILSRREGAAPGGAPGDRSRPGSWHGTCSTVHARPYRCASPREDHMDQIRMLASYPPTQPEVGLPGRPRPGSPTADLEALRRGHWDAAIRLAMGTGVTDVNQLDEHPVPFSAPGDARETNRPPPARPGARVGRDP